MGADEDFVRAKYPQAIARQIKPRFQMGQSSTTSGGGWEVCGDRGMGSFIAGGFNEANAWANAAKKLQIDAAAAEKEAASADGQTGQEGQKELEKE